MLAALFEKLWYQKPWFILAGLLLPLSALYALLAKLKKQQSLKQQKPLHTPVIVVGNISVGGTGKTPLVIAIVQFLQQQGLNVAVISRGFGGRADYPYRLDANTCAEQSGDEPLLIYQTCQCDVVVDPKRNRGIELLLQRQPDVIVSDDGLQHYAMARSIEIAVIDGRRQLGNRLLLPAGPLRETAKRLQTVDFIVVNGGAANSYVNKGFTMTLQPAPLQALPFTQGEKPSYGQAVHAVAGIGNPKRFFASLQGLGFQVQCHPFADHQNYQSEQLIFNDSQPVIMTAKDAVKCQNMTALTQHWYLPVTGQLAPEFWQQLLQLLDQKRQACRL